MKRRLIILFCVAVYAAAVWALHIGCPLRYLTGVPCPGCGMTRACVALLTAPGGIKQHILTAWRYHPLAFVVVPLGIYAAVGKWPLFGSKKRMLAVIGAVCALMLLTYAVRLCLHDPVVEIPVQNGLFYRVLQAF